MSLDAIGMLLVRVVLTPQSETLPVCKLSSSTSYILQIVIRAVVRTIGRRRSLTEVDDEVEWRAQGAGVWIHVKK